MIRKPVTRRDFVKLSAGSTAALGMLMFEMPEFDRLFAAALNEVPVIWMQGGSDSGCTESIVNVVGPTIYDVLLGPIGDKHLSMQFHQTIMAGQGDQAMEALYNAAAKPGYVLVMEGAIAEKDNGVYATVGEQNGVGISALKHLLDLAPSASAVIALGACCTGGGIPAAPPNVTGVKAVSQILEENSITTPLINIPGCPPHPDWFVGTVASILIGGLDSVELDSQKRPTAFFAHTVHDHCERRGSFEAEKFAKKLGEDGCLYELGCKGPQTHADCPTRLWNNKTSWCVATNSPCIGCAAIEFPFELQSTAEGIPLMTLEDKIAVGVAGGVVLAGGAALAKKAFS
jgi:hydrogenase small subunit